MFILNEALITWRNSILAKETCTANDLNELESHLLDEVDQLRQNNLTEEEAFFVAVNRIGKPANIAEEFAKVNGASIVRKKIVMACSGILGFLAISNIASLISHLAGMLLIHAAPELTSAAAGLLRRALENEWPLPKCVISMLQSFANNSEVAEIYIPAYSQILVQVLVFITLAIIALKLAKGIKPTKSILFGSAIIIIAVHVIQRLTPILMVRTLGPEGIGKLFLVNSMFGLTWAVLMPILLAILILKLKPKEQLPANG